MDTSQLTFTRFIAAFLIVYYHYGFYTFPANNDFINLIKVNLDQGVTYFYTLSGFVMMLAYGNRGSLDFREYISNRIARVYPLHIFSLLLGVLVALLLAINYLQYFRIDYKTLSLDAILLHAWFPKYALSLYNTPSWSVSVEFFFYLCFPFIFNKFITKFKAKTVIFSVIFFWIAGQLAMNLFFRSQFYKGEDSIGGAFLRYNPLLHLGSFLIGIGAGILFRRHGDRLKNNFDLPVVFLACATLLLPAYLQGVFIHNGFLAFNFAAIIFLTACNTGSITKFFKKRLPTHLGEISFSVYMLQNPVFTLLKKIFTKIHLSEPNLKFLVGSLLLLLISHFVYTFVEQPMRTKMRRLANLKK